MFEFENAEAVYVCTFNFVCMQNCGAKYLLMRMQIVKISECMLACSLGSESHD
jgi:heme/copper-type cytochrome/quinol oxidase subunit 2